jgi:hypothetical protein
MINQNSVSVIPLRVKGMLLPLPFMFSSKETIAICIEFNLEDGSVPDYYSNVNVMGRFKITP